MKPHGHFGGLLPRVDVAFLILLLATAVARAETPRYFQQLIDKGRVSFQFYDPAVERPKHTGLAVFYYETQHHYSYRYKVLDEERATRRLNVTPSSTKAVLERRHTILIPNYLDNDQRWANRLVQHEFDHVAISSDPRPKMLLEQLLRQLPRFEITIGPLEPTDATIRAAIDKQAKQRSDAVVELVGHNYVHLDAVTFHGIKAIGDRRDFFTSLYEQANLEAAKFPYLSEVRGLLKTRAYRTAELPYRFDEE